MQHAARLPSVACASRGVHVIVKAELPDVKKEDIKVNVENGTLSISGERKVEKEEKGVLTIHLPKNPNVKTKARQITVQ